MAITITSAEVKRKAMITVSDYDSSITSLISEMLPALEYSICDRYIADTSTGLQATLKLGILEIITGEFIEQLRRELGATEQFVAAGITIGASPVNGVDLIQQGATRLAPYLKSAMPNMGDSSITSNTSNCEMEFATSEEVA